MNLIKYLVVALSVIGFAVQAGTVEVKWHDPKEYTDIKPANESKKSFQRSVFKHLEKHWAKMAEKELPDNISLKVKVTNLNLAGDVRYNFSMSREIRLVKHLYWPSIEFEYSFYDGEQLIKTEQVTLKDMAFMDRGSQIRRNTAYYYEKRIITDWFVDDVQMMLAQWKKQQTAVMS